MSDLIKPKQKRSEVTQNKILKSLNDALKDKFFEHISIAELAEGAGVSVGTFYRRFKDKNALIPLLYQDFGGRLNEWVTQLESVKINDKEQVFTYLSNEIIEFIKLHRGVFRTLHLYSRLYPGLVPENKMSERTNEFKRIARWLEKQLFAAPVPTQYAEKTDVWVFMMVDTLIEKILYGDLTPAMACPLNVKDYAAHLSHCLLTDYRENL